MRYFAKDLVAALLLAGPTLRDAGLALLVSASPLLTPMIAWAADKPAFAPPAPWVKPVASLPATPASDGAAVRLILDDKQLNVTAVGTELYMETAYRLETPEGLAAGTITFPWKPDTDTVTVHKIHVIRDGKVIDVLASQEFTVLRRETNLERAALDGTLTATLQPEGLQVGDIVDLSLTIARADPLFRGKPEWLLGLQLQVPVDESRLRVRWPDDLPMRWRTTDPVPALTETRAKGFVELATSVKDLQPAVQPKFAPARFATRRQAELTAFRSWAEVGALLAPLYAKAATIPPGSPLATELDTIRAASPDPKTRAEAALRLVEDRVRYLFLGLGDGSMVPADAATTWSRRFGDCKGKTVLLLALLHAMGIEADPVAVNAGDGDGIDQRLPMISLFNHVLVRATIAGKTYWLDGTRIGDRKLEDIPPFAFKWGLPLVAEGATLVAIPLTQPTRPFGERSVTIDARAGVETPAPLSAKLLLRGDAALMMKARMANATPADRERTLNDFWRKEYPDLTVKTVASSYDEAANEYLASVEGTTKMDWSDGAYEADDVALGWKADLSRDEGPRKDAPYLVAYPSWDVFGETILLPNGGKGFAAGPAEVSQTVGGIEYRRHAEVKDGKYVVTASTRALTPEFPASEAAAAQKALRAMRDKRVLLNATKDYRQTDGDMAAAVANATDPTQAHVIRGDQLAMKDQYDAAIAEYSQALAADPRNVLALRGRGWSYGASGKKAEAARDIDAVIAIDPKNEYAWRLRGLMANDDERWADAVKALTVALGISPADVEALKGRARAAAGLHDDAAALQDADAALVIDPADPEIYLLKANVLLRLKRREEAIATAAACARANPDLVRAQRVAATLYLNLGRRPEAMRLLDRAVELEPAGDGSAYLDRAWARPREDRAGRRGDLDMAVKLAGDWAAPRYARATLAVEEGDLTLAARLYGEILVKDPKAFAALGERGLVHLRRGETALADADFAAARKLATTADQLNNLCWDKATAGLALERALAECDAALAKLPDSRAILDSRGLVLLRLGRNAEARTAYERALGDKDPFSSALYGRGIARLRTGDKAGGEADLAAATALSAMIAETYRGYGVTP